MRVLTHFGVCFSVFFFCCVLSGQCVWIYVCVLFSDVVRHCLVGQGCILGGGGGDNQDSDVSSETVVLPVITTSGLKNIHTHTIEYTLVCVHMH